MDPGQHLPPEVFHQIVGYLSREREATTEPSSDTATGPADSLQACTFVSRKWLSAARPYIFESVTAIVYTIDRSVSSLVAFLGDNVDIPRFIRKVKLTSRLMTNRSARVDVPVQILANLLHRLPNTQSVTLQLVRVVAEPGTDFRRLALRELILDDIVPEDKNTSDVPLHFIAPLHLFSQIDSLHVNHSNKFMTADDPGHIYGKPKSLQPMPQLEVLNLTIDPRAIFPTRYVLESLYHLGAIRSLRSLSIGNTLAILERYLLDILRDTSGTLETLAMDLELWRGNYDEFVKAFAVLDFSSLKQLKLSFFIFPQQEENPNVTLFHFMIALLSVAPTQLLTLITLQWRLPYNENTWETLVELPWARMDAMLMRFRETTAIHAIAMTQRVSSSLLRISNNQPSRDKFEQLIATKLPRVLPRNILSIVFVLYDP